MRIKSTFNISGVDDPLVALNINTPEDYAALRAPQNG